MPDSLPLSARLTALSEDERKAALARVHPLYNLHISAWRILLAALEGTGGFLDGGFLWRYPREEPDDFKLRQQQARYHNYAKTLINIYVRYLFRGGVKRETANADLKDWWTDVDGAETKILDFMKRATRLGLGISHVGILMDKDRVQPLGPSKAEDPGRVAAILHTPISILDWRTERNGVTVTQVKFREAPATDDLLLSAQGDDAFSYLIWDAFEWVRYSAEGERVDGDVHPLGMVPLIVMRPEASSQYPFLGQPLLGNANVLRALFNRCSEEDEVIRNQAFSVLAVSIAESAPDGAVEKAKTQLGTDVGTTRAIVVQGTIDYKTPDQNVPGAIRENIQFLIQEVYRMAHVFYQRDSKVAETAEAIKLKHSELQEMLVGLAEEAERVEKEMARQFFLWIEPSEEAAAKAFDDAQVNVQYPREFFVAEMLTELEKWAKAVALNLGETTTKTIKKQAADALLPTMDDQTRQKIHAEIDAQQASADVVPFPAGGRFGSIPPRGGASGATNNAA